MNNLFIKGGGNVNVIVHHPEKPENINALQKKVAVVHADAVLRYVQKLNCPKEQKLKLMNALKDKRPSA